MFLLVIVCVVLLVGLLWFDLFWLMFGVVLIVGVIIVVWLFGYWDNWLLLVVGCVM